MKAGIGFDDRVPGREAQTKSQSREKCLCPSEREAISGVLVESRWISDDFSEKRIDSSFLLLGVTLSCGKRPIDCAENVSSH